MLVKPPVTAEPTTYWGIDEEHNVFPFQNKAAYEKWYDGLRADGVRVWEDLMRVGQNTAGDWIIATGFTYCTAQYAKTGEPLVFETVISLPAPFGEREYCRFWYRTWADADAGHKDLIKQGRAQKKRRRFAFYEVA